MSALLSVLATRDPSTSVVNLYKTDPKSARRYLDSHGHSCAAFIETICDLDEAHFISKFHMADLVENLSEGKVKFEMPPRDRLMAAKELAKLLSVKQKELPEIDIQAQETAEVIRCFPPQAIITPCKRGTKTAMLLELLIKGSTLSEMMEKLSWKAASVQAGLNWDLQKRKGVGYRTTMVNGEEFYNVILPKGYVGPLFKD